MLDLKATINEINGKGVDKTSLEIGGITAQGVEIIMVKTETGMPGRAKDETVPNELIATTDKEEANPIISREQLSLKKKPTKSQTNRLSHISELSSNFCNKLKIISECSQI